MTNINKSIPANWLGTARGQRHILALTQQAESISDVQPLAAKVGPASLHYTAQGHVAAREQNI